MSRRRNEPVRVRSESNLAHDGRGVIKLNQRVYFVDGVLADEEVVFTPLHKKRGQYSGRLENIIRASDDRVEPPCEYFGVCGGCSLQHLDPEAQIHFKAQTLEQNLARIGKVSPRAWLPPVQDTRWHYRRKARPGVKYVPKKGGVIIGFREKASAYITSLKSCLTLDVKISDLLAGLHELFARSSIYNQLPQLEVAVADNALALVVRHLAPFSSDDLENMTAFARQHAVQFFLQPGGLNTIHPLYPESPPTLYYELPEYALKLEFLPSDFIQVNAAVNRNMISLALEYLELSEADAVLDLFCGLGNFSLPLATSGARVMGVEGEPCLVERARHNAVINQLSGVEFMCANLHQQGAETGLPAGGYNKLLLDPPRSGAELMVEAYIPILRPALIVYISCNPATLARDAGTLVHKHGYVLEKAGVIDMFPHTAHVESIAVFRRV